MAVSDEIILLEKKLSQKADSTKKDYQELINTLNVIRLLSLEDCPVQQCDNCKAETLKKCKETLSNLGIKTD